MGRLPRRPFGVLTAAVVAVTAGLALTNTNTASAQAKVTFAVELDGSTVTAERGGTLLVPIRISRTTSDRSKVFLGARNVPKGMSLKFNDNPIIRNTNLTIKPAESMRNGSYKVSISGSVKGRTSTKVLTVKVVDPGTGVTEDTFPPVGTPITTTIPTAAPTTAAAPTTTAAPAADFTITPAQPTLAVQPGGKGSLGLSIVRAAGFTGPVSIAVEGMPSGGAANINPNPVTGNSATLEVVAPATSGSIPLTLRSGTKTATVTLQIGAGSTAPATGTDFTLAVATAAGSVKQGSAGELGFAINRAPGFITPVLLSMTGQPNGVTVTFSPANPNSGNDGKATISVAATATVGSYPVTITGVAVLPNGTTVTKTVPFTLAVAAGDAPAASGVTLTVAPNTANIGQTGKTTVAVALNGATAAYTMSLSPSFALPAGVAASWSSTSTTTGSILTINTNGTPIGTYQINIVAQGPTTIQGSFNLNVTATTAGEFDFGGVTPLTVGRGAVGVITLPISWAGTAPQPITYSVAPNPTNVTLTFLTNPAPNGTTLQVSPGANAVPGTYQLVVTGVAGNISRSIVVAVTIS
jgi:hypothetical protein